MMNCAQDLESFKLAHDLTLEIYKLTAEFVGEQRQGLGSKIRDRAEDINANLLAGSQLNSPELYKEAVNKSKILLGQLEYYLMLAKDLEYLEEQKHAGLQHRINQLNRILSGMKKAL
ncbi:four helix bundle protein [Halanaerobacter jeridensis]|uniref:Four helix bundle protein n=1 Tax=Halanaerobacter jeridensis TaxID=706427 RepID=A0A938XV95_9FIRM|nr:four helix bundle protein [Halanaerobacter jeridensis]MBM7557479.1 four helix bundle protein [Halanaerobacter jeridensis]